MQHFTHLKNISKQETATTSEHIKISFICLKRNIISEYVSTIWENIDGCDKKYRCATSFYLLSILVHEYDIIIDQTIGEPVHG